MTPISQFRLVWGRCDELSAIHKYFTGKATSVLNFDELLRAEWVARVSALDLFVHELVTQHLIQIFNGSRATPLGFKKYTLSGDTLMRTREGSLDQQASAFELDIRTRLSYVSYQEPEKIADGVRLISNIELWNELADMQGVPAKLRTARAKALKLQLAAIIDRRNKIAHEGDLRPGIPRTTWEIQPSDLLEVRQFIDFIVTGMDALIWQSPQ